MIDNYDLHSPFDLERHMDTYVNYMEAIIEQDGSIHYAVPSHTNYLERKLMEERGWDDKQLEDACPREYWCDYITWLLKETGCISVWTCGYMLYYCPTDEQEESLASLIDAGLIADENMGREPVSD